MKKYYLTALILISFFLAGARKNDCLPPALITNFVLRLNDKEAIKNIIQQETDAYVKRDSSRLFSFYSTDSITQSAWNNPDGTFGSFKGIQQIRKNFSDAFKANPVPGYQPTVERSEWFFRPMGDNWMWVNFTQVIITSDRKKYTSYETRIMKKESSEWKIAVMYALSDHGAGSKKNN